MRISHASGLNLLIRMQQISSPRGMEKRSVRAKIASVISKPLHRTTQTLLSPSEK